MNSMLTYTSANWRCWGTAHNIARSRRRRWRTNVSRCTGYFGL